MTYKPGSSTAATANGNDGQVDVEIEELVAYGDGRWEVSLAFSLAFLDILCYAVILTGRRPISEPVEVHGVVSETSGEGG